MPKSTYAYVKMFAECAVSQIVLISFVMKLIEHLWR